MLYIKFVHKKIGFWYVIHIVIEMWIFIEKCHLFSYALF